MTLAITIIVAAALALFLILRFTFSQALQVPEDASAEQILPVDIEAFRNLVSATEAEYLRRCLPPAEFRIVQRKRLHAMAAYCKVAGQNAAVLVRIGQASVSSSDPRTADAARELVNNALLLRRNAAFSLLRIYGALAWPHSPLSAGPVLDRYERLSASAMLLGRIQNPAVPVRISARP